MTTASAVATILKRCNELLERHRERGDEYAYESDLCEECLTIWPCTTYELARDLREAVVAGTRLAAGVENWMSGEPVPSRMDALGQTLKALDTYRETFTTIAERGKERT